MTDLRSILTADYIEELEAERKKLSDKLRGKYAGMSWAGEDDSKLTIQERASKAYWRCIHCDSEINDNPDIRERIAESAEQKFIINGVVPREVCFVLPYECATINRFAADVEEFLVAKKAKEQGNEIPLMQWFTAWRAHFYKSGASQMTEIAPTIGSYDPKEQIPNQHSINMLVDCQKAIDAKPDEDRMGSFWVTVEAVDMAGNVWQKARHFCTSKEEVEAVQKYWKIPNARVCIDGGYWSAEVKEWCAKNYETVDAIWLKMKYKKKVSWLVFVGDDANYYWHGTGRGKRVAKAYSEPHPHQVMVFKDGHSENVSVPVIHWSNTAIKDSISESLFRSPGKPKLEILGRHQLDEKTREKESGDLVFEKQVNGEYRTTKKGKPFWEKKRPENHYFDCLCMGLVRRQIDGFGSGIVVEAVKIEEETETNLK